MQLNERKVGICTADYPLMLLNDAKRDDYTKLIAFFRGKDFQTKMSAATLHRPINADATTAAAIPKRTLIELPFPAQAAQIDSLLDNFLNTLRIPGSTRYVLDLSGSMTGDRIANLKQSMLMLASDSGVKERFARFQNREEVGIITFSSETDPTRIFPMGSTPEDNARTRAEITNFIRPLNSRGGTAIYSSVMQAIAELSAERAQNKEKRYYTVVLMTDGENNRGLNAKQFAAWYRSQGESVSGIRVFPILFGEGDKAALQALADLTGGRLFDSRSKDLTAVFKEIRGYQ